MTWQCTAVHSVGPCGRGTQGAVQMSAIVAHGRAG